MRDSLAVGDEITTIGGIIGEIVRIKDETVTIETGKDRTKIRILRTAIRSVDVHAVDKFAAANTPAPAEEKAPEAVVEEVKPKKEKKNKKAKAEDVVIEATETAEENK